LSKAQWNDDFHHALHVLVTGEDDGYYIDYTDPLVRTGRILAEGFAYQGEPSVFGKHPRGEPSGFLPPTAFISFLQNHDQVGNRALGERLGQLADPGKLRIATAILLLSPQVPMLFMGEEYAAPEPFLYFCEYDGELAAAITKGRRSEFGGFRGFDSPEAQARIPDPNAVDTFARSRLRWETRDAPRHREWLEFTRKLLGIRREQIVPLIPFIVAGRSTFAVDDEVLTVRWPLGDGRTLSLRASFTSRLPPVQGELLYPEANDTDATGSANSGDMQLWIS
jgi:malto-oligosyltrehalose trehalohydrolase